MTIQHQHYVASLSRPNLFLFLSMIVQQAFPTHYSRLPRRHNQRLLQYPVEAGKTSVQFTPDFQVLYIPVHAVQHTRGMLSSDLFEAREKYGNTVL